MSKLKVFVSSVQQELEDERLIVQNLIQTDPFLQKHCSPVSSMSSNLHRLRTLWRNALNWLLNARSTY